MIKYLLQATFTGFVAMIVSATAGGADPRGVWLTEDANSHIEIRSCGEKLCGKIVWMDEPNNADGSPKLDTKNKNKAMQTRPILGLELMAGIHRRR